jgi:hypothetical protein
MSLKSKLAPEAVKSSKITICYTRHLEFTTSSYPSSWLPLLVTKMWTPKLKVYEFMKKRLEAEALSTSNRY